MVLFRTSTNALRRSTVAALLVATAVALAAWSGHSDASVAELTMQVGGWRCPFPPNSGAIRPLYSLAPTDAAGIAEARERIELISRDENDDWDLAAIMFHMRQFNFWTNWLYVDEYQRRAVYELKEIGTDRAPGRKTPEQIVDEYRHQYDEACAHRNKTIETMAAAIPALSSLRRETVQPWMDPGRHIPCGVARVDHCEP